MATNWTERMINMAAIKKNTSAKYPCQWCKSLNEENKLQRGTAILDREEGYVDVWVCRDEMSCVERTLDLEDKLKAKNKKED